MKDAIQDSFNHLMSLAQRSHQKGDFVTAANLYKEALKVIPNQPDALQYLGIVFCSQQKFEEGIRYLEKANIVQPNNPVLLVNLSNAYIKTNNYASALTSLEKAIHIKSNFDEAWYKLALTLRALGKVEEAIHAYQKTIELNPKHFNAWYNLGNTMLYLGNYRSAIINYEKCLSIKPDFALAHNNIGIALMEWEHIDEAEHHYLKSIQLNPSFKEGIRNLCLLYEKAGKEEQASYWKNELLKLYPAEHALQFYINTKSSAIYNSRKDIEKYQKQLVDILHNALKYKPQSIDKYIEYNCYPSSELAYQGKINKEIKELFAGFYSAIPRAKHTKHINQKCHVGFVVTSGHEGVFLKCMRGILNNIDTSKLDVSVVCSFPNGGKIIAPHITNPKIKFVLLPQDFDRAQQAIIDAQIDVLHYWEIGTDSINYFLALTKPAPIQITSWGWPATSGLQTVDYFISQKNLETGEGYEHYTEQLVLFEKMPVYYYRPPVPLNPRPLSDYKVPSNTRLYICQQNLRKVHPDFDVLMAELLDKDQEGIILFIKDKQDAITQALKSRLRNAMENSFSRVMFLDRMSEEDYLGILSQCTVVLDTLYYGGGANTIYDAVEAAIPVVTLEGSHHSARFAAAAFRQMEVTDTIVYDLSEYVDKAISIAADKVKREEIIQKLKENSYKIFEDRESVIELENFFLEKWKEKSV